MLFVATIATKLSIANALIDEQEEDRARVHSGDRILSFRSCHQVRGCY